MCAEHRVAEALDGYRELIDYWDRTSGWARQWTTLRNLADLLRTLGDEETAAFLDAAADHAPDASPLTPAGAGQERGATGSAAMAAIREAAASASRSVVLERAREAIARHRAAVGPAVGSSR